MSRKPRATDDQCIQALTATAGNVSMAAKQLGLTRFGLHYRINSNPKIAQALADIREEFIDIAESALKRNVINGDNSAIFYALNNSPEAKRRGWGPRQEVAQVGEVRVKLQWGDAESDDPE